MDKEIIIYGLTLEELIKALDVAPENIKELFKKVTFGEKNPEGKIERSKYTPQKYQDEESINPEKLRDFGNKLARIYRTLESYQVQIDLISLQKDVYLYKHNSSRIFDLMHETNQEISATLDEIAFELLNAK